MKKPLGAEPDLPLVLIVEDASFNLHAERITLEASNYRVINTEEGGSAIVLAKLHRPDLILLDLGLPDMSGRTVIANLKSDDTTREIPILVCTADDRRETLDACLAEGCTGYLLKPFSSEQLLEAVERILTETRDGAPSGPAPAA
jgi:two-component system cell cycle response regulator DivK